MTGTKGMGKGNTNASLAPTQRHRVKFSVSISGESLNRLVKYIQVTGSQESVTNEQIAAAGRQMLEEWIETLEV